MNTAKILGDVCKAFCTPGARILIGDYGADHVGVSLDGFCVHLLKKADFPFDRGALLRGAQQIDYKKYIPEDGVDAILTNEMVKRDAGTVQRLTDGKYTNVWINTKFLKNFAKHATFRVTGQKSGVLVYENETLAGMIMPVNMQKG
jgi:hypothetical protein